MNNLSYMSVKGQGHSLTFAKGHSVCKPKSCFFFSKSVALFETKYRVKASGSSKTKKYNTAGLGHMT